MGFPYFGYNSDFGFLPPGVNADVQVFNAGSISSNIWQQWVKPRGISTIAIIAVGAGGGGGGGFTGATTTARGGGAGGACSCLCLHIFPAYVLPDILKIKVGIGGAGGSGSGQAGSNGSDSLVATGHGITGGSAIPNRIVLINTTNPGGGAAGANSGSAVGGAVPNLATKANSGWNQVFSLSTLTIGIVGATGGVATGGAGTAITAGWNTIPLTPGAGGGGVNSSGTGFAGGEISLQAAMDFADASFTPASSFLAGGAAGSGVAAGGNGLSGIQCWRPFLMTGGTGGGSADGQLGGRGGDGAIGCGGGGGGGGTTGGAGGRGGDGIVIIISW